MEIVNTIEWMLSHQGVAVARIINNDKNTIEIIKYSENTQDYPKLREFAKSNNLLVVIGKSTEPENRLGDLSYFLSEK